MSSHQKRWILEQLGTSPILSAGPIGLAWRYVSKDVWLVDDQRLSLPHRALNRVVRVGFLTLKSFAGDRCILQAMALTYITVLSLVPLLAFAFATIKGLGWYEDLRVRHINPYLDGLFGKLDPDAPGATQLRRGFEQVLELVDRTDVKALGSIGLLILMMAVVRLLSSIEGSFNEIWGVRKARTWVRKLSDYLTIVVITPIFLVVAVGFTSAEQSRGLLRFVKEDLSMGFAVEAGLQAAPLVIGWLVFTLIYLVMPNRRGKLGSAAIGGAVAGLLWQISLLAHIKFQVGVARYNAIYAGFAALPIFLAWVQISWLIVLFGAELAFAHESEREYRGLAAYEQRQFAFKRTLALRAMTRICESFVDSQPPLSTLRIGVALGVSPREIDEVLVELERGKLAARVDAADGADGPGWLPARDPASIRVTDVLDALSGAGVDAPLAASDELDRRVDRLLAKLSEEALGSAYNRSLRELVEEARSRVESAAGSSAAARVQTS